MNLGLSEEQELLRNAARDMLAKECPMSLVRDLEDAEAGYAPDLWRSMADLGWTGLIYPEKYGGADGNFLDLTVLEEELGRVLAPTPFFSTVVVGGRLVLALGNEQQKQEILSKISQGQMILAPALFDPQSRYNALAIETTAVEDKGEYVLNGTKLFVAKANVADLMLVSARAGSGGQKEAGLTLFLVDPKSAGVTLTASKTISAEDLYEVALRNVRVPKSAVLGEVGRSGPALEKVLDEAKIALCAEVVGGLQAVMEMSVDYAKERHQFGQAIGAFQAIQHKLANMATDLEGSRWITYRAAWLISEGRPGSAEIAQAKAWVADAGRRVTAEGQQIHGGYGYMWEYDVNLYFRRIKAAEVTLGDADYHREKVAQAVGL